MLEKRIFHFSSRKKRRLNENFDPAFPSIPSNFIRFRVERKGASGVCEKKEGIGEGWGTKEGGEKKEREKKIADRKELPRGEARLHGYFVFCEWGRTLVMVIVQQRGGREKWHKRETAQKRTRLATVTSLVRLELNSFIYFPRIYEYGR